MNNSKSLLCLVVLNFSVSPCSVYVDSGLRSFHTIPANPYSGYGGISMTKFNDQCLK